MEVAVDLQHAFGSVCGSGYRGTALFGDDTGHVVLHPVGRHVVSRHIDQGEATFLGLSAAGGVAGPQDEESSIVDAITTCTISRDRLFLAVAERRSSDPFATVAIYDLRVNVGAPPVQRLGLFRGAGSKLRIAAAAFSADSEAQQLALLSVGQEVALTLVDWRDDRVLARVKLDSAADRVLISPQPDVTQISVSGPHLMRVAQLKDAGSKSREPSLKLSAAFSDFDESSAKITDHAWVEPADGSIFACTLEGAVVWLCTDSGSVKARFGALFGPGQSGCSPFSVQCFSQGFLLGGSEGMIALWEKVDGPAESPSDAFRFGRASCITRAQAGATICGVDMTTMEDSLLISFRNGDIGTMPLPALFRGAGVGDVFCNVLSGGFHSGPIVGLDIAVHRPLFVSLGKRDGVVRIWNYVSKRCEIRWEAKDASDPPSAVAVHPFGASVALAFAEKLRCYYILAKGLKLQTEFSIRAVKLVRYSNGGHLLVAAQGKFVHVFSVSSLRKLVTLQGHSHSITTLCFNPEDTCLWTCDSTGHICQWEPLSGELLNELPGGSRNECLAVASGHSSQLCCSVVHGKKAFLHRMQHCVQEYEHELLGKVRYSSLCQLAGQSALFAGSNAGVLSVFPSVSALTRCEELALHAGACTSICISADGRVLVTAGEDGAIFLLNVHGLANDDGASVVAAAATAIGDGASRFLAAEAVLVQRAQLQKRIEQCKALRIENNALHTQLTDESNNLEEECQAKVADARERDQAEIRELGRRKAGIERASAAKTRESQRIMKAMSSSHCSASEQLGNLYKRKAVHEEERFAALEAEKVRLLEQLELTQGQVEKLLKLEQEQAKQELERRVAEKELEIKKNKDLVAFMQHRFEGMVEEEAAEHDLEIAGLQLENQKKLKQQKEVEAQLKKEQDKLLVGLEIMEEERVRIEREQYEQSSRIRNLQEQAEELQRALAGLEVERRERESTLGDKEQKIESYRTKVNTLKKFKVVLDKQLQEVTESLQPKEELIAQLSGHLNEMEGEFQRQLVEQRAMDSEMGQKKRQLVLLREQQQALKEAIMEKDRTIVRYTYDLNSLVKHQPDLKQWPAEIRRMYHTYGCDGQTGEDRLPLETLQKKMNQVERRVASLKVNETQMRAKSKADIQRKAHENAQLVNDVNRLRKEKVTMLTTLRGLKARLEELEGGGRPQVPATMRALDATPPSALATLQQVGTVAAAGGGPPGPRQQLSASTGERPAARARAVPPLEQRRGGSAPVRPRASQEDMLRMQVVLQQAELGRATAELQRSESALLRERIDALLQQRPASAGGMAAELSAASGASGTSAVETPLAA